MAAYFDVLFVNALTGARLPVAVPATSEIAAVKIAETTAQSLLRTFALDAGIWAVARITPLGEVAQMLTE